MGILDWFKNRESQFDPDRASDQMTLRAIDKAVTLTNPRLKLVRGYQERLAPAVDVSVRYLREIVLSLPPSIKVSAAGWSADPLLRALFVAASDIPAALGRSANLRTLFDKYPALDEAHLILVMRFSEQRVLGMSLHGGIVQRDVTQTVVGFSDHQARICGHQDAEVDRLLGSQGYEYLVAQALSEIGEERSERRGLEETRSLIRARLRLLQQQGPGLGSVFGSAPAVLDERARLEAELLGNERQLEAIGSPQSTLEAELETLCDVLAHPQRYLGVEQRSLRLDAMNVVLNRDSRDAGSDIVVALARLSGTPPSQRVFVPARFSRSELPALKMNFEDAQRYL